MSGGGGGVIWHVAGAINQTVFVSKKLVIAGNGTENQLQCNFIGYHMNLATITWSKLNKNNEFVDFFYLFRGRQTHQKPEIGNDATFECGQNLVCKSVLIFTNLSLSDSGQYRCRIVEAGTNKGVIVRLSVMEDHSPTSVRLFFKDPNHNNEIEHNEEFSLICISDGYPEPDIFFLNGANDTQLKGFKVSQNYSMKGESRAESLFKASSLPREPTITIVCSAKNRLNPIAIKSEPLILTRYYPPQIEKMDHKYEYKVGNFVQIQCSYKEGNPPDTDVKWVEGKKPGGTIVQVTPKLLFSSHENNIKKSGFYTCVASNKVGYDYSTIQLEIASPPEISTNKIQPVIEFQSVTISCYLKHDPNDIEVWWSSKKLKKKVEGISYFIESVTRDQAGLYTCHARTSGGTSTSDTLLTVRYPPELSVSVTPNVLREGQDFSIECTVTSNPPCQRLLLTKKYGKLSETAITNHDVRNKKSLTVKRATREDAGIYQCLASNGIGENVTRDVHVQVQYGPIIKSIKSITGSENGLLTKTCEVDSVPKSTIVWTKFGDPSFIQRSDTLTFNKLKPEHSGVYQCNAEVQFKDGEKSKQTADLEVFVRFKPIVTPCTPNQTHYQAKEGTSVTLCCQSESLPQAVITWIHPENRKNVLPSARYSWNATPPEGTKFLKHQTTRLTINSVMSYDYKKYTCEFDNEVGDIKIDHTFSLVPVVTPSIPKNVLAKFSRGNVYVSWTPGHDGGALQHFVVGYRPMQSKDPYTTQKGGNSNKMVLKSLPKWSGYEVAVKACNKMGCSPFTVAPALITGKAVSSSDRQVPLATLLSVPLVSVFLISLIIIFVICCRRKSQKSTGPRSPHLSKKELSRKKFDPGTQIPPCDVDSILAEKFDYHSSLSQQLANSTSLSSTKSSSPVGNAPLVTMKVAVNGRNYHTMTPVTNTNGGPKYHPPKTNGVKHMGSFGNELKPSTLSRKSQTLPKNPHCKAQPLYSDLQMKGNDHQTMTLAKRNRSHDTFTGRKTQSHSSRDSNTSSSRETVSTPRGVTFQTRDPRLPETYVSSSQSDVEASSTLAKRTSPLKVPQTSRSAGYSVTVV